MAKSDVKVFHPYGDLDNFLDSLELKVDMSDTTLNKNEGRMSTGLLMLDLILGGGITAGWYTNFGYEQSCKSSVAMTMLTSALKQNVPIIYYCDYEGSSDPVYIESMMQLLGVRGEISDIFGIKDKDGKYIKRPRIRYRDPSVAEQFFNLVAGLERKLPDKRLISGEWFYIYEDTKENRKLVGNRHSEKYFKTHNKLKVPAEDGSPQAVVVVDSYPSMLPESMDVDEPSAALAVQARMFSKEIQRIKGRLRSKRIAILGVNQLRTNPGARFGNPEYEPGGNALKTFSDVRLRFSSRAISGVPEATGKGAIETEPSVLMEGDDVYRYTNVRAHKNKLGGIQGGECFLRLWTADPEGKAWGFDPVFDTYEYLKATGQVEGRRKKMRLKILGNETKKPMGWLTFKKLILGKKKRIKKLCKKMGMKPMMIRNICFKQVRSGKGSELLFEQKKNSKKEIEVDKDE